MPSHASSPSLDKALPALPVEGYSPVQVNETQSDEEENGEELENGSEKVRNPKKGRRRKRGGKRNNKNGSNNLNDDKGGQSSPETSMKQELAREEQDVPMVVVDSAPAIVAKDQSSSGRVGNLLVSESVLGECLEKEALLESTC